MRPTGPVMQVSVVESFACRVRSKIVATTKLAVLVAEGKFWYL
jgi:hypothetical protein